MNGLKGLVEGHIAALALLAHLEEDVGLTDAPLRRENKHLALGNALLPVDFIVSTDDVFGVQVPAGVDLHRKRLPPDRDTRILTYVKSDVSRGRLLRHAGWLRASRPIHGDVECMVRSTLCIRSGGQTCVGLSPPGAAGLGLVFVACIFPIGCFAAIEWRTIGISSSGLPCRNPSASGPPTEFSICWIGASRPASYSPGQPVRARPSGGNVPRRIPPRSGTVDSSRRDSIPSLAANV